MRIDLKTLVHDLTQLEREFHIAGYGVARNTEAEAALNRGYSRLRDIRIELEKEYHRSRSSNDIG